MVYPPYATPFPDARPVDITLGAQQRAMLTLMAQRPGHVFTTEELVSMDPGINRPGGHNQRDELLEGQNLALYGRADHSQQQPLTLLDKQKMGVRQIRTLPFLIPPNWESSDLQIAAIISFLSAVCLPQNWSL